MNEEYPGKENRFRRSHWPWEFVASSVSVWALTGWGLVMARSLRKSNGCLSDAILYLALPPVLSWGYSLYVLKQLKRSAAATADGIHSAFPVLIAVLLLIVEQAILNCHGR
jgi:hypothetical protein